MSLATRCSACGTVFRVVQDQLRVSGGWVRCGRCSEVFNAIESLLDLEVEQPTDDAGLPVDAAQIVDEPPVSVPTPAASGDTAAPPAAAAEEPSRKDVAPDQAPEIDDDRDVDDAETNEVLARGDADDEPAVALDLRGEPLPAITPAFMRRAERAARWRHPAVRLGLGAAAIVATALLALQITLAWHDIVAARWPVLHPMVERLCAWQGCRIGPPRRIESLTVDSSGLVRAGSDDSFRLAVVLRNREPSMALRLPSIDLTLTDTLGQPLARRVIDPAALGSKDTSIGPGAELALSALLRIGTGPAAGYTIELFYP